MPTRRPRPAAAKVARDLNILDKKKQEVIQDYDRLQQESRKTLDEYRERAQSRQGGMME